MPTLDLSKRHSSVRDAMRWLEPNPNLPSHLRDISQHFYELACELLRDVCEDSPQLTLALHTLTQAKDHAVRARILSDELHGATPAPDPEPEPHTHTSPDECAQALLGDAARVVVYAGTPAGQELAHQDVGMGSTLGAGGVRAGDSQVYRTYR